MKHAVSKYKSGDWVKTGNSIVNIKAIGKDCLKYDPFLLCSEEGFLDYSDSLNGRGRWKLLEDIEGLASDEEIREYLKSEAEKRYPIGCCINSAAINGTINIKVKGVGEIEDQTAYGHGWVVWNKSIGWLYGDNQWAEIISSPMIKIGNHEVAYNFQRREIIVGCIKYPEGYWNDLLRVMRNFDLKSIQHNDGTVATRKQIEDLIMDYEAKLTVKESVL